MTGDVTEDGGGGTYFVDHDGRYYYQTETADGQQVMTVVSGKYCHRVESWIIYWIVNVYSFK